MPRHSHNAPEKSKDFKGSMIKIIKSLKPWSTGIIISIALSFISAILGLITPNKLSQLTDYITEGITPRINEEKINEIMNNPNIPTTDKQALFNIMITSDGNIMNKIDELPNSIYEEIKPVMHMEKIKSISLFLISLVILSSLFNL